MSAGARGLVLPAIAALSLLLFAAPALGADRFADPNGDGIFPCADTDPCSLPVAVSTATSGDTVFPAGGIYILGTTTLELPVGVSLDGAAGVTISSTAQSGIRVVTASSASEVRDLTLNHAPPSGGIPTFGLELLAGKATRLNVTSNGDFACLMTGMTTTAVITNSICHATGANGTAVGSYAAVDSTAEMYGVTAVADHGNGLFVNALGDGADVTLAGYNVISQGATFDQRGHNSSTTSTSSAINLSYSNFDSLDFTPPSGSTGTLATVNNNQSGLPLLDANLRQLPGSPTIDAGGSFLSQPLLDIDGDERPLGDAIDIGADEADGTAPNTMITGKPPKRTRNRTAKFKFTSSELGDVSFECKIDAKPFKPCSSGVRYRNLKRGKRHRFRVRATDAFLNTDATPAGYGWKILR